MHLLVALAILVVLAFAVGGDRASQMLGDGNWAGAFAYVAAPLVLVCLVNLVVWGVARLILGRARIASFTSSRIQYVGVGLMLLSALGQIAKNAGPS